MLGPEARPRSPRLLPYLVVLGLADFCHAALLFGFLHDRAAEVSRVSLAGVGGLVALYLLADFALRLPAARFLRWGTPRSVLVYALAASALSFALIGSARSFPLLGLGIALHGLSAAPLWPAALAGAVGIAGERGPGLILQRLLLAALVAAGLGAAVGNLLLAGGTGLATSALMAVWIATVLCALVALPEAPTPLAAQVVLFTAAGPVWPSLARRPRLSVTALLQGAALGMLVTAVSPWGETLARLSHTQVAGIALTALMAAVIASLAVRNEAVPRRDEFALLSGLLLAALVACCAPGLRPLGHAVAAGACLGAGGALVLRAWTAAVLRPHPSADWASARLALMMLEGFGMTAGAVLCGVLWTAARPAVAFGLAALLLLAACVIHGVHSLRQWRHAPSESRPWSAS